MVTKTVTAWSVIDAIGYTFCIMTLGECVMLMHKVEHTQHRHGF